MIEEPAPLAIATASRSLLRSVLVPTLWFANATSGLFGLGILLFGTAKLQSWNVEAADRFGTTLARVDTAEITALTAVVVALVGLNVVAFMRVTQQKRSIQEHFLGLLAESMAPSERLGILKMLR
ncbi:hypothetical protein E2493_02740 [Sphingomonas parva]|uniref:Uncharacterized protein n=1 Tax=Sphingomonas parva TaxID=2555898 RepID=A0A4Y8ZWN3_9SPHN|nr:hypothetical protein [Sphingomonas parva]TFI59772.1 hypothetical protein E2493_02740 [Sphingomonas parva]